MIHANHSKQEATQLCHALNQQRADSAEVCFADLSLPQTPAQLIQATLKWQGQLDVVINNASLFIRDPNYESTPSPWETLFTVNVRAPYELSMLAYPHLCAQQGCIINLTDIHAHHPLTGYAIYCQTKAALSTQTLALAKTFAPTVRVNGIAPGAIAWPEADNTLSPALKEKIISQTPLQRHGHPIEIASAVLFLVQHTFITGQIIQVDGGRSLS
jgi:pteridine reductase